jgi:hypothetical protein
MDKLKWQIHAETSITQIMFWIIIWKLFCGWVGYLAIIFIVGNIYTALKATFKLYNLDKNYFK